MNHLGLSQLKVDNCIEPCGLNCSKGGLCEDFRLHGVREGTVDRKPHRKRTFLGVMNAYQKTPISAAAETSSDHVVRRTWFSMLHNRCRSLLTRSLDE